MAARCIFPALPSPTIAIRAARSTTSSISDYMLTGAPRWTGFAACRSRSSKPQNGSGSCGWWENETTFKRERSRSKPWKSIPKRTCGAWKKSSGAGISMQAGWPLLLADAEAGEDQVQDVIGGGLARDGVKRAQRAVKIEHDHFMRNASLGRETCRRKTVERLFHQSLMADVGEKSGFLLSGGAAGDVLQDRLAKVVDARSGDGRGLEDPGSVELHVGIRRKVGLVSHGNRAPALPGLQQFPVFG